MAWNRHYIEIAFFRFNWTINDDNEFYQLNPWKNDTFIYCYWTLFDSKIHGIFYDYYTKIKPCACNIIYFFLLFSFHQFNVLFLTVQRNIAFGWQHQQYFAKNINFFEGFILTWDTRSVYVLCRNKENISTEFLKHLNRLILSHHHNNGDAYKFLGGLSKFPCNPKEKEHYSFHFQFQGKQTTNFLTSCRWTLKYTCCKDWKLRLICGNQKKKEKLKNLL